MVKTLSDNVIRQRGFTLVESMVIIAIISILSLLSAAALPRARASQQLTVSGQQLQALFNGAQQQSLDEVRTEPCLVIAGGDAAREKACSNIGVGIQGTSAVVFADLDGSRTYQAPTDFLIATHTLTAGSTNTEPDYWQSFVFEATPPTVTLFADGIVVGPQTPALISLQAAAQRQSWAVYPYGRMSEL